MLPQEQHTACHARAAWRNHSRCHQGYCNHSCSSKGTGEGWTSPTASRGAGCTALLFGLVLGQYIAGAGCA